MSVEFISGVNCLPIVYDASVRPFPHVSKDVHVKIFNYLPIMDQVSLSLSCRYAKRITDLSLCLRARDYGYPSDFLPSEAEAKEFLATLFKVVRALKKGRFLDKTEIHFVSKKLLFLKYKRMDCERTLLNISNSHLNRLAQLYTHHALHKVDNVQCLLFCMLKDRPLDESGAIVDSRVQKKLDNALLVAINKSEYSTVELRLKQGADPNVTCTDGFRLKERVSLGELTPNGQIMVHYKKYRTRSHISNRADFNFPNQDGNYPLHLAAKMRDCNLVELLLQHNAQINARGKNGNTPLRVAAWEGFIEIIELLLENGADPNISADNGSTPMDCASAQGHIEIITLLLMHSADINLPGCGGLTPLGQAKKNKQEKAIQLLQNNGAI